MILCVCVRDTDSFPYTQVLGQRMVPGSGLSRIVATSSAFPLPGRPDALIECSVSASLSSCVTHKHIHQAVGDGKGSILYVLVIIIEKVGFVYQEDMITKICPYKYATFVIAITFFFTQFHYLHLMDLWKCLFLGCQQAIFTILYYVLCMLIELISSL